MKTLLIILSAILLTISKVEAQPKIIFDTDFGGDADDLGALAMLHYYIDQGDCELLAIMSWSQEKYVIPAIDAVNRYYGNPTIPIAVRQGTFHYTDWNYNKPIADRFDHKLNIQDVPGALDMYRKLLAEAEDNSITIVTVGPLKNIENLIRSGSDQYSNLNGKSLINQKVKEFVIMGGKFPEGEGEWNFDGNMEGVTQFVLQNLEVPVVFSGYEIGSVIKSGKMLNKEKKETPLTVGYLHYSKNAPWIKKYYKGEIINNSSFDQTAVFYAVKGGVGKYWEKVDDGYCIAEPNGDNRWVKGNKYNHAYLKLIVEPEKMAKIIANTMLHEKINY